MWLWWNEYPVTEGLMTARSFDQVDTKFICIQSHYICCTMAEEKKKTAPIDISLAISLLVAEDETSRDSQESASSMSSSDSSRSANTGDFFNGHKYCDGCDFRIWGQGNMAPGQLDHMEKPYGCLCEKDSDHESNGDQEEEDENKENSHEQQNESQEQKEGQRTSEEPPRKRARVNE